MAKIKTRKPVDLTAVDKRLAQLGLQPGMVSRHNRAAGEWELETADPSISNADLQRVITDVPEAKQLLDSAEPDPAVAARAARKTEAQALLAKGTWQAKDTEAAVRLLLTEQVEA